MGKGDRRTAKGKRFVKSFGKSRPKGDNSDKKAGESSAKKGK